MELEEETPVLGKCVTLSFLCGCSHLFDVIKIDYDYMGKIPYGKLLCLSEFYPDRGN